MGPVTCKRVGGLDPERLFFLESAFRLLKVVLVAIFLDRHRPRLQQLSNASSAPGGTRLTAIAQHCVGLSAGSYSPSC